MGPMRLTSAILSLSLSLLLIGCGGGGNNFTNSGSNNSGGNNTGGSSTGGSTSGGSNSGGSNTGGNTGGSTGTGAVAGTGSGSAAADTISGRVLDAATNQPISGNVLVALESQPQDGIIVNETSPDAQGNFSFTNLSMGSYALVVTATNSKQAFYTPVILGPSGPMFGNGQNLQPGTNVGVIPLPLASGSGASAISVPVESDKPITVTLDATITVGDFVMEFPWPQGIPTFDTANQAGCANGAACATNTVSVPSVAAQIAVYNGTSTKYSANTVGASYDLSAKAYTQNGAQPTCSPSSASPIGVNVVDGKTEQVSPFKFTNCQ